MNLNWFQLKGCSHRYTSSGVARQVTEFHHLRGSTLLNTATTALDSILLVPTVHARRTTRPIPLKLHNLRQSRRILVREIRPRHRPPHTCPCTTFLFQYPRRHTLYLQRIQTRRRCLNEPGHRRIKSLLFVLLAVPIPRHPRWSGCLHRPNPGDALRPPSSYQPSVFSPRLLLFLPLLLLPLCYLSFPCSPSLQTATVQTPVDAPSAPCLPSSFPLSSRSPRILVQ